MRRNYYVYCHRRKDTGEIFYIGRGTGSRYLIKAVRNARWKIIVDSVGFYSEKLWENLSLDESYQLEEDYISLLSEEITNKGSSGRPLDLNTLYPLLSEYLIYDELSPSCLVWKKKVKSGRPAGSWAGTLDKRDNRYLIKIHRKTLFAHRVVYLLTHGYVDKTLEIDHIDGDSSNNLISNLRAVSHGVNSRNRVSTRKSCTGFIGVDIEQTKWGSSVRARVHVDGKRYVKKFNLKKYDYNDAVLLACEWREQIIKNLDADVRFTDRHGYGGNNVN